MPEPDAQLHEVQPCIMSMQILGVLVYRTSFVPRGWRPLSLCRAVVCALGARGLHAEGVPEG